jgi:hypothetical protein
MAQVNDRITARVLDVQQDIFRLAQRDYGLCLKAISDKSNIPYNTIRSYAGSGCATAAMPVPAMLKLADVIPDELLSRLTKIVGRCLIETPKDMDFDEVSDACRDFISAKDRAHHPDSEAGRDIGPGESDALGCKVVQLRGKVA